MSEVLVFWDLGDSNNDYYHIQQSGFSTSLCGRKDNTGLGVPLRKDGDKVFTICYGCFRIYAEQKNTETEALRQRIAELEAENAQLKVQNARWHEFTSDPHGIKLYSAWCWSQVADTEPTTADEFNDEYLASETVQPDIETLSTMQAQILFAHVHDDKLLYLKNIELRDKVIPTALSIKPFADARGWLIENGYLDNSTEPRHTELTRKGSDWVSRNKPIVKQPDEKGSK